MVSLLKFFCSKKMHTVKISSIHLISITSIIPEMGSNSILPLFKTSNQFPRHDLHRKTGTFLFLLHCYRIFFFSIFLLFNPGSFVLNSPLLFSLLFIRNAPMSLLLCIPLPPHPSQTIPDHTISQFTGKEEFHKSCTGSFHFLVLHF